MFISIIAASILAPLGAFNAIAATTETVAARPALYPVTKVVDGDTIDVKIGKKTERIRLIGIDTPEIVDPRKPVQCFGKEASLEAKKLLQGKTVSLEADKSQGERDKYGRLLRYVLLPDRERFNKLMVSEGYAHEYTYSPRKTKSRI